MDGILVQGFPTHFAEAADASSGSKPEGWARLSTDPGPDGSTWVNRRFPGALQAMVLPNSFQLKFFTWRC